MKSTWLGVAVLLSLSTHAKQRITTDWVEKEQLPVELAAAISPSCKGSFIDPLIGADFSQTSQTDNPGYFITYPSLEKEGENYLFGLGALVEQNQFRLSANWLQLNSDTNLMSLKEEATFRTYNNFVVGKSGTANMESKAATFQQAEFVLHKENVHGSAKTIKRTPENNIYLTKANITRCEPGSNAWRLSGQKVIISQETGTTQAFNSLLYVYNVPVFYLPYISFVNDERRKTGFLNATYQFDSFDQGLKIKTAQFPFYLNLAPSYDSVVTAYYDRLTSTLVEEDQWLLGNEFRYKTKNSDAINTWNSKFANLLDDTKDNERWRSQWNHFHILNDQWKFDWQVNVYSDSEFQRDYDFINETTTHNDQTINGYYKNDALTWHSKLSFKQPLEGIDKLNHRDVYNKVTTGPHSATVEFKQQSSDEQLASSVYGLISSPFVQYRYSASTTAPGKYLVGHFDYNFYTRQLPDEASLDDPAILNTQASKTAHRFVLAPTWGYNYTTPMASSHIKINGRANFYDLDCQDQTEDCLDEDTLDNTQYAAASLTVDNKLNIEKKWLSGSGSWMHAITPGLRLDFSPYVNQDDIPNLTGATKNDSKPFLFTGLDRFGDTKRLTWSIDNRLMLNNRQRIKFKIDQDLQWAQERVTSTTEQEIEDDFEPILHDIKLNLTWNIAKQLTLTGQGSWNHEENLWTNLTGDIFWQGQGNSYLYAGTDISAVDDTQKVIVSSQFPIKDNLGIVLFDEITLPYEDNELDALNNKLLIGIEYESCCWAISLLQYNNENFEEGDGTEDPNNGLTLQFELKGIGQSNKQYRVKIEENLHKYPGPLFNFR